MKKRHTIIATHGMLAKGLASALNIIVGELEDTTVICGYTTPEFDLTATIDTTMASIDASTSEVVVFTDLLGGSINNGFITALSKYHFHLFTNTNLAVLMDYYITHPDLDEFTQKLSGDDFKPMDCNALVATMQNDLEDDL